MKMNLKKSHPILKILNNSLVSLPTPSNISYFWNFGSLLGLCLIIQLLTGLFLAMHYTNHTSTAFESISHICRDVNYGWMMRTIHANGASMFFISIFLHTGRNIYFESFKLTETWNSGIIILFTIMATAFLGYVLPWGQMSFWGATVITNLVSAIPYVGTTIVQWIWGGFAVEAPTLSRFFTLHFLMPFVATAMIMNHLMFLHQTGSSNPLGSNSNLDKMPFHPFFSFKDILGMMILVMALTTLSLTNPYMLGDPDNFIPANPLVTPVHIQPEWYFLFAYAILRSIPNKLGGVIALVMSISILFLLPLMYKNKFKGNQFYLSGQINFWLYVTNTALLTWIGARPVETPFIMTGQILTVSYFMYFAIDPILKMKTDYI